MHHYPQSNHTLHQPLEPLAQLPPSQCTAKFTVHAIQCERRPYACLLCLTASRTALATSGAVADVAHGCTPSLAYMSCSDSRLPGCRCWSLLKTGMSPEDILMEEEAMLQVTILL